MSKQFEAEFTYLREGDRYDITVNLKGEESISRQVFDGTTFYSVLERPRMTDPVAAKSMPTVTNAQGKVFTDVNTAICTEDPAHMSGGMECFLRVIWISFAPSNQVTARAPQRFASPPCGVSFGQQLFSDLSGTKFNEQGFLEEATWQWRGNAVEAARLSAGGFDSQGVPQKVEFNVAKPGAPGELIERYAVLVKSVEVPTRKVEVPVLTRITTVSDLRFSSDALKRIVPLIYQITNNTWLEKSSPELKEIFKRTEAAEIAVAQKREARAGRRWYIYAFVAGAIFLPLVAVMVAARKKERKAITSK